MRFQKAVITFVVLMFLFSGCAAFPEKASSAPASADTQPAGPGEPARVDGIPMDERTAVITDSIADIYAQPDIQVERITQALYNQPVTILDEKSGWARVAVVDGSRGWIRTRYLDKNVSSIYGRASNHRIVVTSKEKSIFSSPANGYTVKDVPMGAEFLTFNNYGEAYEVYLPGNRTGWLRGSGIIHIALDEEVPVTTKMDFVATALKFKGTSFLLNGLSTMGMDASGLVYISARVNGVDLSRNLAGQYLAGTSVEIEDAAEGDLVFLAADSDPETPSCVGICIGDGSYIYSGKLNGYVTVCGLKEENREGKIIAVKRIFT